MFSLAPKMKWLRRADASPDEPVYSYIGKWASITIPKARFRSWKVEAISK